ncbi:MAG: HD domain-containing protein [Lachnospiraceae bacterium]|nr:HD domain-containing protein [Lachnospiraceae bacterium]
MMKRTSWTWLRGMCFCIGAVALNILGTWIGSRLGDIFYFDTIGTMMVAAVSGYFPGIFVALLSNILTSILVPTRAYYAIINVLIAVVTSYFYRKEYLRKVLPTMVYVLILVVLGGGVGTLIEWGISGQVRLAEFGHSVWHHVPDKLICAALAYVLVHIMPMRVREMLHNVGWLQSPVSDKALKVITKNDVRRVSIRMKIVIVLTASCIAIAAAVVVVSLGVFTDMLSYQTQVADQALLMMYQRQFIVRVVSITLGFWVLILAAGLWFSKYHIVYPLNTIVYRSKQFDFSDDKARIKNVDKIREIGIHTGDEIENIYFAFLQSIEETMVNFTYMKEQSEALDQLQSGLIMVLADLVENRDSSTGDHVRKTATYVGIVLYQLRKMGYYTDQLTDQFISDVIKSAPLHDIGKIQIPDAILTKHGKLTDEEFEIMKHHTDFGAKVIEQAIESLPNSDYLKEAKNMAAYHHEKWNGKGYPEGLSGEDIPLSARVMAVADVFDALISKRCYKGPYTFEEAMKIIRKDAGSHFDPKVAEAFLAAEEEVRKASQQLMDMNYTTKDIIR